MVWQLPSKVTRAPKHSPAVLAKKILTDSIPARIIQAAAVQCSSTSKTRKKKVIEWMIDNIGITHHDDGEGEDKPIDQIKFAQLCRIARANDIDPDIIPPHIDFDRDLRCHEDALPGATVCYFHGGSAPQVQEAARRRLIGLADPMINVLEDVAMNDVKGAARVAAANSILDRGIGKAPQEIKVEHDNKQLAEDLESLSDADLKTWIALKRKMQTPALVVKAVRVLEST
jgi:hypothetical protein